MFRHIFYTFLFFPYIPTEHIMIEKAVIMLAQYRICKVLPLDLVRFP